MTRTNLRAYTPEFRTEAVKLVLEQGISLEAAAQWLSIPKGTLSNWVMAAKRGTTVPASRPDSRSVGELEEEIARLRRELAIERIEKEVLKKAMVGSTGRALMPTGRKGCIKMERYNGLSASQKVKLWQR
jgi:transposase